MTPEARRAHLALLGKTFLDEWQAWLNSTTITEQKVAHTSLTKAIAAAGLTYNVTNNFGWRLSNGELYHYDEPNI